ncbi:MAG: hypothetical protein WCH40_14540 [Verrucomicrobiales bacterium]
MKKITIRHVSDRCVTEAEKRAKKLGVSMNTVFQEALKKGLGIEVEKATNGLEIFSGKSDFGPDWDAYLGELRIVGDG